MDELYFTGVPLQVTRESLQAKGTLSATDFGFGVPDAVPRILIQLTRRRGRGAARSRSCFQVVRRFASRKPTRNGTCCTAPRAPRCTLRLPWRQLTAHATTALAVPRGRYISLLIEHYLVGHCREELALLTAGFHDLIPQSVLRDHVTASDATGAAAARCQGGPSRCLKRMPYKRGIRAGSKSGIRAGIRGGVRTG